jgi:hypothetical protein
MIIVLNLIAMLGVTSKIGGLHVLRAIVARTIQLVDVPEVQTQIRELVRLLRPRGCLLKRQVHVHLKSLRASRTAIKQFRAAVTEMDSRLPGLLERAMQEARDRQTTHIIRIWLPCTIFPVSLPSSIPEVFTSVNAYHVNANAKALRQLSPMLPPPPPF